MIQVNFEKKLFKIDTPSTSYVCGVAPYYNHLVHLYYGKSISDENLYYLAGLDGEVNPAWNRREKLSFMDCAPFEYPESGVGDFRPTALEVVTEDGASVTELIYDSYNIYNGKKPLPGLPHTHGSEKEVQTLEIILKDSLIGVTIVLSYSVFEGIDAIIRSTRVINESQRNIRLNNVMSTCLELNSPEFELITLNGTWARERAIERRPLRHGYQGVSSVRGITSHQEHPFAALVTPGTTQTMGEVYGFNFVYSGNFKADVYLNQFDMTRVTMGINPQGFSWKLEPGCDFVSPEAVMVYSSEGLGKMTRTFHNLYRNHLIRSPYKDKKRPILINNWEATYFNFNTEKLLAIAKEAAQSGIEMLVMDDGWFGHRNDDNSSLGDWVVNEEKLPGGLKPLVDGVNSLGMKFGIWMEPEMVCPDSDLFRAHPDWAIQVSGREGVLGRNQYVLDLTRSEVLEHTWNSINNVMKSANIEYVKWDMNRALCDVWSNGLPADRQGEFYHRYVLAVYELQNRLITNFPNLLLENCSSGGARFDPGMLYFSPQIWCSDDTDAIERLSIQEGTMIVYPLSTMGAHISDCPNHILGRTVPFETRGHVALAGTFGYELDITRIPEEDRNMIPAQTAMYHKYNDLVRMGDYYRIASFRENGLYDCWSVNSQDRKEILVTFVSVFNRPNYKSFVIKLQGLDPDRVYTDEETGRKYKGDVLMNAGLTIERFHGDYRSKLIHFVS